MRRQAGRNRKLAEAASLDGKLGTNLHFWLSDCRLQQLSNALGRQGQPTSYSTLKAIVGSIAVALRAGMSVAIPVDKSSVPAAATRITGSSTLRIDHRASTELRPTIRTNPTPRPANTASMVDWSADRK